jgi:hypothetical protein
MKRPVSWLLVIASLGILLPLQAVPANAYTLPDRQGTGFYVQQYWQDPTPWGSGTVMKAYRKGWHADGGSPNGSIILHFGRQYQSGAQWGVIPINESYKPNDWVRTIAQAFIDGYNDNPAHPTARIAVGTSNSDYNWYCRDEDPSNLSSLWRVSGNLWGQLVLGLSGRSKVTVSGGNDIESWYGEFDDGWVSCGIGTKSWIDGYEQGSYTRYMVNFGSNAHAEYSPQWTLDEQWQVSWGKASAYMYPQIYCYGVAPSWISIRQYSYMTFFGVISDNAQSSLCGSQTLTWQQSWNDLEYQLNLNGYYNALNRIAIHYFKVGW